MQWAPASAAARWQTWLSWCAREQQRTHVAAVTATGNGQRQAQGYREPTDEEWAERRVDDERWS
jgi:hypothetical protein